MRYLIALFLIIAFVVGCGCSNSIVTPAYGYTGDACDVFPCFYGVDNGGPDEGWIVFRDQNAGAWQAPRMIDDDLLDAQWTPQRNGIGWDTTGKWNVSFVEDTGNDLELWESPDDGWQDDAGAWAMTDSDASENWDAIDVESRQDYVWALLTEVLGIAAPYGININLNLGAPGWTDTGYLLATLFDNTHFSIVLDEYVQGNMGIVGIMDGTIEFIYAYPSPLGHTTGFYDTGDVAEYPQIINNFAGSIFCTYDNILYWYQNLLHWPFPERNIIYTATTLTDAYHATWLAMDDTIHVVLVDFNVAPDSTLLIYLRRTANGWSAPVTLLTVDSDPAGDIDGLFWPQITVDSIGNIVVYYIRADNWVVTRAGDLQARYLDSEDYDDFATPATWTEYTDVDQSEDLIEWCVAPDYNPTAGDF